MVTGTLSDVREALDRAGAAAPLAGSSLLPRIDDTLRRVLGEGSRFATCRRWEPDGAESPEETPCSWAG